MSELEESAAQEDGIVFDDAQPESVETTEPEAEQAESAPADAQEEKPEDGFQKRINKVTADKYAEKRRADKLQQELEALKKSPTESGPTVAPKLEDFDYDQDAFNDANVKYQVAEALKAHNETGQKSQQEAAAKVAQDTFVERITKLGKPDFDEVSNNIPLLPDGVAGELMKAENGAELIYHLGTHLDQADRLASMSPQQAMMELGRISATMSAPTQIKPSAAPDPIEPLNSGGTISKERGPDGVIYE